MNPMCPKCKVIHPLALKETVEDALATRKLKKVEIYPDGYCFYASVGIHVNEYVVYSHLQPT